MTLVIGFVELNLPKGKNDPRDFGWVLLSGALLETIALVGLIADGNAFGAIMAAAFTLLLWALGLPLAIGGGNRMAVNHAVWFTGLLFLFLTIFAAGHGLYALSVALGLLVIATISLGAAGYTGNATLRKIGAVASLIDAFVFLIMAIYAGTVGIALP
jgi:hypothetical protein